MGKLAWNEERSQAVKIREVLAVFLLGREYRNLWKRRT
jgi:hypothetical protein